ncbi:MAG: glycosyltransferase [Alphaproteobacteria bacterium]|nr:glycosyltransferase [Alphaproteobacteria bacterium]
MALAAVIPTLNAAAELTGCLAALNAERESVDLAEIVVADGGSSDRTRTIAGSMGARVVEAPRGRGIQLNAGAGACATTWLLFVHADTVLAPGWSALVGAHMADPGRVASAGYFRFRLDDQSAAARRLEWLVARRCAVAALPYGDQGLLISRNIFNALGGFPPIPLMEDVALIRRLGRRRLVPLAGDAVTSAARYRRDGYWRRPLRNLACLSLYFLGVPPARIARLYQ